MNLDMKKAEFIKKFSKIEETFEDEFRAEFNSPELIWDALKEQLSISRVVGQSEQCCEPISKGFYLGTSCPKCKKPFRQNFK